MYLLPPSFDQGGDREFCGTVESGERMRMHRVAGHAVDEHDVAVHDVLVQHKLNTPLDA